jgi:hypothetical protein
MAPVGLGPGVGLEDDTLWPLLKEDNITIFDTIVVNARDVIDGGEEDALCGVQLGIGGSVEGR